MARPDKVAVVTDVRKRLDDSTAALLTEYRGLTVSEMSQLRTELRKSDAEYRVAKNTLVRLAVRDAGLEVPDEVLTGPTAVAFCAGDPVAVAKVLRTFSRTHRELVIKGGVLEGRFLGAAETLQLADLASREELLARLAGLLEAVLAQPARLALASLTKAARLFAAYQQKREEGGEVAAVEAPGQDGDAGVETLAGEAETAPVATVVDETPAGEAETAAPTAVVDETPAPDSPAAQAVTEAAGADPNVNATPVPADEAEQSGGRVAE